MTADEQIARWAAKRLRIEREKITDVEFVYRDGETSEAGTYWPPEVLAYVHVKYANGRTKRRELYIGNGDTTELIREILSA